MKSGYSNDTRLRQNLSRVSKRALGPDMRRDLNKSHLKPGIRLLKLCMTANLSRVSRQTHEPDLRRDSDSLFNIVGVTGFQV